MPKKSSKAKTKKLNKPFQDWVNQAHRHLQEGNFSKASDCFASAHKLKPDDIAIRHDLAYAMMMNGQLDAAEALLKNVIGHSNQLEIAYQTLATTLSKKDATGTAFSTFLKDAMARSPDNPVPLRQLIIHELKLGNHREALPWVEKLLNITPNAPFALNAMADIQATLGNFEIAVDNYTASLAINPSDLRVHEALTRCFYSLQNFEKTKFHLDACLRLNPQFKANYHFTLGDIAEQEKDFIAALQHFKQSLEANPDSYTTRSRILGLQQKLFQYDHYDSALLNDWHAMIADVGKFEYTYLFKFATHPGASHETVFSTLQTANDLTKAPFKLHHNRRHVSAKLRVGFVSGDFCNHPVSKFSLPLLLELKNRDIEVFCYSSSPKADSVTDRFKAVASKWIPIFATNDESAARQIAADEIDILFDLSGYTTGHRLQVFQFKPAPVQIAYLGFVTSTGLATMDYWIVDEVVFPHDIAELTSETPYRLKRPWVAYTIPYDLPEPPPLHRSHGAPIVFGSANNLLKFSPQSIELFATVLDAVPNSRFLIKHNNLAIKDVRKGLARQFALFGIEQDRLIFEEFSPKFIDHATILQSIDVALDTTPFSGGTTTCDLLSIGVPVLTLAGNRFMGRMSTSMLTYLDLQDWVANTPEEFVLKAVRFGYDFDLRAEFRNTIRSRMATNPLCDVGNLADNLIAAFHKMLQQAR